MDSTAPADPWASGNRSKALDSLVMESRDRLVNLAIFAAAVVVWLLVGSRPDHARPGRGSGGRVHRRGLIGLAVGTDGDADRLAAGLRPPPADRLPGRLAARRPARRLGRAHRRDLHRAPAPGRPRAADRAVHGRPRRRGRGDALRGTLTPGRRAGRATIGRRPPVDRPGATAEDRARPQRHTPRRARSPR